mmetsp:Transcript_29633/g.42024  ORF Transcript_29633/g.42024 Transcript_29633/m.42024 type:complete len:139 (-) Transcript_29633:345-761(-)
MRQIRACTEGKGGHAAFASIMWSPPATMRPNAESQDFFKNLLHVKCDVLLIFGEQDPWCKPAFAKKNDACSLPPPPLLGMSLCPAIQRGTLPQPRGTQGRRQSRLLLDRRRKPTTDCHTSPGQTRRGVPGGLGRRLRA